VSWRTRINSRGFWPLAVASVAVIAVITGFVWIDIAGRRVPSHRVPVTAPTPERSLPVDLSPSAPPATPSASKAGPGTSSAASRAPVTDAGPPAYTWQTAAAVHVDAGWVAQNAARTGIPVRALTAYADAQLVTDTVEPGCHLPWTMLAGIGLIESGHGRHGGATLLPDGTTSIRILGPPLDGTSGNIAIHATADGMRMDGDPKWDHAVGPMQFIPSTWAHWGVSVDQGVPNPNDIDDAALTAARYLCAAGGDLATALGWQRAISAYNAPPSYTQKVVQAATTYARAALS
jgi:membrane-bound lytic murein transglycosylase B